MTPRRPVAAGLFALLVTGCMTFYRDPVGASVVFRETEYFVLGATGLRIDPNDLIPLGNVAVGQGSVAADGQVYRLDGVDENVVVVMRAQHGTGVDYLLLATSGALRDRRYDSIPGLCDYVEEAARDSVGC